MARLKTLKPQVGKLPSLLRNQAGDETQRSRFRDDTQAYRRWYKTARWQKLRERIMIRDLYTCKKTGVMVIGKYPAPNSAVVDHIKPHRGDPVLFWDEANLMTVSKAYHDQVKQSEERRGLHG